MNELCLKGPLHACRVDGDHFTVHEEKLHASPWFPYLPVNSLDHRKRSVETPQQRLSNLESRRYLAPHSILIPQLVRLCDPIATYGCKNMLPQLLLLLLDRMVSPEEFETETSSGQGGSH